MKNLNIIISILLIVFVGIGGFYMGMKYQQNKQSSISSSRANDQSSRARARQGMPEFQRGAGSDMVRGEIISKDKESMIVKLPDDSSKIILISDNTEINKASKVAVDDLKAGEQVVVFGKTNSDGSLSATQVQLNFGFGPPR